MLGQTPQAERLLARALELAPGYVAARHIYAVALFRQDKAALALPHVERLPAGEPRHLGYRVLLASTLASMGEFGRAIALYETIASDAPKHPAIWINDYARAMAETEAEIRRLLAFCGLPFEAACLRFWETRRGVSTASSEQVRQPIFREGLEQWRHFEPWLGPLKNTLG